MSDSDTISEMVAAYEKMEEHKRGRKKKGEIVSESDTIKRRDRAAKALGISTNTLSKAKQVIDNGDKELISDKNIYINGYDFMNLLKLDSKARKKFKVLQLIDS